MSTLAYPQNAQPSRPSDERLLWGCVVVSLLLHALIVWQGRAVPPAPLPPQLKVNIRLEPKPAPPPPAPAQPRQEVPPPEPPRPEVAKPEPPKPVPQPHVTPKAEPVEPKPAPKPVTPAPQVAPTPPAPAPAPSDSKSEPKADTATAAPTAPAAPVAPSTAGPVDNDLRAIVGFYQQQLAQQTEKRLRYPAEAQDQGWTGVATVRLRIDEKGMISGVDIVNSSGHEMLDNEAKIAAQKAKPFVQLPAGLRGKAFEASFRVIFKRPDQPG